MIQPRIQNPVLVLELRFNGRVAVQLASAVAYAIQNTPSPAIRRGDPDGERPPHLLRPFCVETLDLYVSSPCAMGIISKSVAHSG